MTKQNHELLVGRKCLNCGYLVDDATPVSKSDAIVEPDSITICCECGHIMALDENLQYRELNDKEIHDYAGNPDVIKAQYSIQLFKKLKDLKKLLEQITELKEKIQRHAAINNTGGI